jgi:hypothetical protein
VLGQVTDTECHEHLYKDGGREGSEVGMFQKSSSYILETGLMG